ncbi:MAG TPA: hypothetical protein GXX36_09735 [Clostridiaceae bacterium]|nr:hypothetical protein [Clostridiaceae bacterium]
MKCNLNRKIIILAAVVLAGLISATVFISVRNTGDRIIFTVDGDPVTYDEFIMQAGMERANVISYFQNQYKAQFTQEFWNTPYAEEYPKEKLKKVVIDKLIRTKVIKKLALDYGIISDTSYKNFISEMKKENKRRAKAIKDNQPVYGPKQFSIEAYYSYYMSTLEVAIKNAMKAEPDQKQEMYEQLLEEKIRNAKIEIMENELSSIEFN